MSNWIDCALPVCRSTCLHGCEHPRSSALEVKAALAYLSYYRDPLDLSLPIPSRVLFKASADFCTCAATPEEMHHADCAARGLFHDVALELNFDPSEFTAMYPVQDWQMPGYYPQRWLCSSQDTDEFHTGGEINGPTHWCEREKRMVSPGE